MNQVTLKLSSFTFPNFLVLFSFFLFLPFSNLETIQLHASLIEKPSTFTAISSPHLNYGRRNDLHIYIKLEGTCTARVEFSTIASIVLFTATLKESMNFLHEKTQKRTHYVGKVCCTPFAPIRAVLPVR